MPNRYPPEFRRKVLDPLAAGGSVASLSADLGAMLRLSQASIWHQSRGISIPLASSSHSKKSLLSA